jgi:hypothetical protein
MSDQVRKGWGRDFFQAPNEIFDRRDINVYAKAVYLYLCRRADDDSQAFPTYARIAADVGGSPRTVRRAIEALIAAGLLLKEARYDRRSFQTSNLYTLIRPSTVPEPGPKGTLPVKDTADAEPRTESPAASGCSEDVSRNHPGCSGGTGGVLCENTPGGLVDQPGWSVGPSGMVREATKQYPSEEYPGEEDPSVRPSVHHLEMPGRKRLTDRRIDFVNFQPLIRYYAERFGANARQVVMAMLAVEAQLDKGTVITNHQAYFEKTLQHLVEEQIFRNLFVASGSDAAASPSKAFWPTRMPLPGLA